MGRKNEPKDHTINCKNRENPERAKALDVLYLYREFQSEAIRFLMPDENFWTQKGLHSFIASLQLGLKEVFKGKVDHLQVVVGDEPQTNSSLRKSFLYLYDTVPGGTGYLKQLINEPGKFKEIFLNARKIVTACTCDDGCYECLFAYRNSFNQDHTSRQVSKRLLKSLIDHWDDLEATDRPLSTVEVDINFDSELEKRFVDAIKNYRFATEAECSTERNKQHIFPDVRKEIFQGRTCYRLKIGSITWRLETQVSLGLNENISIPSRADFVFYPLSRQLKQAKPIVVFTDGWEYHQNRLSTDFEQRLSILRSRGFLCWSLTWDDVNEHYQNNVIPTLEINALTIGNLEILKNYK